MPKKRLRDKPFDEGTLVKLAIFESYTREWLPVFVSRKNAHVHIFDFFAGTGHDVAGVPGSPIRILKEIKNQVSAISANGVTVVLHLNEFEPETKAQPNFASLKAAVEQFLDQNSDVAKVVTPLFYNEDFESLFPRLVLIISAHPSLVFLDQNGIRFLASAYLRQFAAMRETDLLYFASASYLWRFGETEEFRKYLAIDLDELKTADYQLVHRGLVKQLRKHIPPNTNFRLYPFSIRKGANIYGVIFGATHPLAFDKFLNIAWKIDSVSGEANFDINDEAAKIQGKLFDRNLTKQEAFQVELEQRILSGEICSNKVALDFCYDEAHPSKHAVETIRRLKNEGVITYEGKSPLVNYDQVYRGKRILPYRVVKS